MIPNLNRILSKLSNPFIKLSDDESFKLKEIENSVKRDLKELSREAKELFQDQRYQKIKNDFDKIYNNNVKLMIDFECNDINTYFVKMHKYQIQLRTLKSIFDTPEALIRKEEEIDNAKIRL